MKDNSKEMNFNRKKVTLGNYTETCGELKEPVYKRGSKEKEEQIQRWETERNIFKKADNSFVQINEDFKNKKEISHEDYEKENTMIVGNHSVYLGTRKYYFKRFKNMKALFVNFIKNADENIRSKSAYVNEFFSSCYVFVCDSNETFKNEVKKSKGKRIAYEMILKECFDIFDQLINQTKFNVNSLEWYVGYGDKILDSKICKEAEKEVNKSGDVMWFENEKRYKKINELLTKWGQEQVLYKCTKYYIYKDLRQSEDKCIYYKYDMTKLYEILRYKILNSLVNKTEFIALGNKHVVEYKLNEKQYNVAKAFVEEYVCYYDRYSNLKYYSEEDIA